jgi:hypothetical protein
MFEILSFWDVDPNANRQGVIHVVGDCFAIFKPCTLEGQGLYCMTYVQKEKYAYES